MRRTLMAVGVVVIAVLAVQAARGSAPVRGIALSAHLPDPCPDARPVPEALRLPATVPPGEPAAIEQKMLAYLNTYAYRKLGWCVDKYVRDTGPYVDHQYYGTHPAVRIYYSPEMMDWLRRGRVGVPADGAVIIKEQYAPPPAARYAGLTGKRLDPGDWTVMIRRSGASRDGWFWAEVFTGMKPGPSTQYPWAGFGLYCLRCHASASTALTFASLNNITGFAGEPITFKVDNSWRWPTPSPAPAAPSAPPEPEHEKNAVHPAIVSRAPPAAMQTFPAEPLDDVPVNPHPKHPPEFLASAQCMSCHSASSGGAPGPVMWLTPAPAYVPLPSPPPGPAGVNVSEYGEWRWSPMGLAGRDPVFFAQLESELAYLDAIPSRRIAGDDPQRTRVTLKQQVVDTCMRCHGVMGKRTNESERGPGAHFDLRWVFAGGPAQPGFRYGGLARDGISCTVCHHITQTKEEGASLAFVLQHRSTGLFSVGPSDRLQGPFKNDAIAPHPMNESLGVKPVFGVLTTSSRLCTSCHSIDLPVVDAPASIHPITAAMPHDVEQNTYVEWVNSRFQTEYKPLAGAKSCQDCHMPGGIDNQRLNVHQSRLQTQIALVQDQTYPQSEHRAPLDGVNVRYRREGFRRHELLGLNAFLLRTFQRNSDALGVRLNDYMSGSSTDLDDAIGNVVRQAQHATARVDVATRVEGNVLVAIVGVTNLTGHRFPSGVGFRRAWIELDVTDGQGRVVWASGRTNGEGEIVDGTDPTRVLPSEYFTRGPDGKQRYQKHFDERRAIERTDEVQIFEELVQDRDGNLTESFIRRDHHVKDNRLLPQGWHKDGPRGVTLPANWLAATRPEGEYVESDPRYADGKGRAVVTYRIPLRAGLDAANVRVGATLWYQSWQPAFRRARTTGNGPAATRLRVLLGNLDLTGTPLESWKLKIASASASP